MKTLAKTVASFYWQLAGSIHRDIPVNDEGKPEEFNRYVGYFLDEKEAFQGPLREPLRQMAEATYLEAIGKNCEPRRYLRLASRRASGVARRARWFHHVDQDSEVARAAPRVVLGYSLRETRELHDSVEALLLDNGIPMVEQVLGRIVVLAGPTTEKPQPAQATCKRRGASPGTADNDLEEWTKKLKELLAESKQGRAQWSELREATQRLVRAQRAPGIRSRVGDCFEATSEIVSQWSRLLRSRPKEAFRELTREALNVRTLVPAEAYLVADAYLIFSVVTNAVTQINSPLAVLMAGAVMHAAWFIADMASYMIHVNSDGWGDSMGSRVFQDHHTRADEAARWTWLRAISTTAPKVLPFMLLLAIRRPHFTIAILGMVFLQGLLITPKIHGMAHQTDTKGWIGAMQKSRLILSPNVHARHHRQFDRAFGGLNGWSNRVMDGVGYAELYATVRMWMGSSPPKWIHEKVDLARQAAVASVVAR